MTATTQVTFDLPDTESELAFLRRYMMPAWERFEASEAFECGWFWRAGNFARHDLAELTPEEHDLDRLEPGTVFFLVNGDPDPVIEMEREHWERVADEGLLEDWELQPFRPRYRNAREKMREKYGEEGGDRVYALRTIATEASVELLATFDRPLPAVGEATDENPVPIGHWAMVHFLMKPLGYDWDQEIDACSKAIRSRLASLASFTSAEHAQETLREVIEDLEAVEPRLEEYGSTGAGGDGESAGAGGNGESADE